MIRVQSNGVGQAVVIAAGRNRREELTARSTGDADVPTSLLCARVADGNSDGSRDG